MVSLLLILLGDDNHLGSSHFMEDFCFLVFLMQELSGLLGWMLQNQNAIML